MVTRAKLTRKITLEISLDDFRRLDRHAAENGSSKQAVILGLVAPFLGQLSRAESRRIAKQN